MCISSEIFDFQILNGTLTPLKICLGHNSKNVVKGPFFYYTIGFAKKSVSDSCIQFVNFGSEHGTVPVVIPF